MSKETAPSNEDQSATQHTPKLHQVQTVEDSAPAEGSEDNPNERPRQMSRFEWWQVFFSGCATLLGIGGYIILDRQATLMTKQTELLTRQTTVMEQQTALTGDQNELMDRQAATMVQQSQLMIDSNETNRAVQRAIGRFTQMEHDFWVLDKQRVVGFRATWENSGVTDAVDVIQHFHVADPGGDPSLEEFIGPPHPYKPVAVGPRGRLSSRYHFIPQSVLFGREITPGVQPTELTVKLRLRIFGWMAYRDVFPGSKPHVTGFCQHLTLVAVPENSPGNIDFGWEDCGKYNCRDERCDGYAEIIKFLPK